MEKILKIIFFVLLIILIIEGVILFKNNNYNNSSFNFSKSSAGNNKNDINITSFLNNKNKISSQEENDFQKILNYFKQNQLDKPINYLTFFKKLNTDINECRGENKLICIYDNLNNDYWLTNYDKDKIINVKKFLKINIKLENVNDLSGISFNNSFSTEEDEKRGEWWKGAINMFFGLNENGNYLVIDARKNTAEAVSILNLPIKNLNEFYIYTDSYGKNFYITDKEDNLIYYFNINQVTNGLFPNGLFPDKKVVFSYLVAPKSKLILYEFLVWNF